ncbi:MAG: transcription termination/antitermination protein NusA [Elusimicrobia bacterium]|nr:transcription termination/antitermination protein NusA [Elusimicrobiota bacterium]
MLKSNLKPVLEQIEKEKGISKEEVALMVENALKSAFKKHAVEKGLNYDAHIDIETGEMKVYVEKIVVKKVTNPTKEVDKVTAIGINPSVKEGDMVMVEVPADKFGRIAAQTAKQIIIQKIRENEREHVYQDYRAKEGHVSTATIYRFTNNAAIVELDKTEAILPIREQIPKEKLMRGDSVKVYIVEVSKGNKGAKILVSRTHPGLVAGLFKLEVPEVADNVVEIVKIVRDPGIRCKVAVLSHNSRVDPIGACVGINGVRVQSVISELRGERMDLIKYSEDVREYLSNSLSPAEVEEIRVIDEEKKEARVIVSDEMLSLAIGKNGQNVRLAARLTNWHLDIQSRSQIKDVEKKEFTQGFNDIMNLPGVGEKTARILFENGFSSLAKIKAGGVKSLTSIKGIGEKTAQKIIDSVNAQGDEPVSNTQEDKGE